MNWGCSKCSIILSPYATQSQEQKILIWQFMLLYNTLCGDNDPMIPHKNWRIDAVSDPSTGFYIKVELLSKTSSQDNEYQNETFYDLEAILYVFHIFPLILLQKRIKNLEWIFLPLTNHQSPNLQNLYSESTSTDHLAQDTMGSLPSTQLSNSQSNQNMPKSSGGVPLTSHRFPSGTTAVSRSSRINSKNTNTTPLPSLQSSSLKASKVVRFDPTLKNQSSSTHTVSNTNTTTKPVAFTSEQMALFQQQPSQEERKNDYDNEDEVYDNITTDLPNSRDLPSSLRRSHKIPIEMTENKTSKRDIRTRKSKQLESSDDLDNNNEKVLLDVGSKRKKNPYQDTSSTQPIPKQKHIEEIIHASNQPKQPINIQEMHPKQMPSNNFKDLLRMAKKTVK